MALYTAPSLIHGSGLYPATRINTAEVFALVFNKVGDTGIFFNDYVENAYGRYVNHCSNPNTLPVLLEQGIGLKALREIQAGEEITADYTALICLFPEDEELARLMRF